MPERTAHEATFGSRVKELREARGWSLSDLARRAAISRSYLFQIENDSSSPTGPKIQALADALGVLAGELLGEDLQDTIIPASLQEFAEAANLTSTDVRMLAQIEYRGKKPDNPEEWRAIYSVIKAMVEG